MDALQGDEMLDVNGGVLARVCVQFGEFKVCFELPSPTFPPILW